MGAQRKQLSTLSYSQESRDRLADAVAKARHAAGFRWRTNLATAAGISPRSVTALERAEPGVGQATLYAVARKLPGWTQDTPRVILEGGPVPEIPEDREPRSDEERRSFEAFRSAIPREPIDVIWQHVDLHMQQQEQSGERRLGQSS